MRVRGVDVNTRPFWRDAPGSHEQSADMSVISRPNESPPFGDGGTQVRVVGRHPGFEVLEIGDRPTKQVGLLFA